MYCTFIYCVASFLRLRECLQESIRQRPTEDQQVRCSIAVVIIWPRASLIITFPFNPNVTCLMYPQQWNSKSLQWKNGLHSESATRDISPYLPWSVYACCVFAHCRFVTSCFFYSLSLWMLLFSEMASVDTAVAVRRHTRAVEAQSKPPATAGGESKNPCPFLIMCSESFYTDLLK